MSMNYRSIKVLPSVFIFQ